MLHPATLKQFEAVKVRFPGAELVELASGAALVTIPDYKLPAGWSRPTTTIRFIVPVGYPGPFPDCFWADTGLRLAGEVLPHGSAEPNAIPETDQHGLWFSWHIVDQQRNWNPNRDDLNTYVGVIAARFQHLK